MTLTFNNIDFMPVVAADGLDWGKKDMEGPNAGDMMNGTHRRDKLRSKRTLTVRLIPLTQEQSEYYLGAIDQEYISADMSDPILGERSDISVMCFDISGGKPIKDGSGVKWKGIEFSVEET